MTQQVNDGLRSLMQTIMVGASSTATFDEESVELQDFFDQAAYLTSDDLAAMSEQMDHGTSRQNRSRVRYLAALLPDKSLHQVADSIHFIMDNRNLSISEIRDVLRGNAREVPLEKIQEIGRRLTQGESLRSTSKAVGVSFDTVERIESFIGLAEARRLRLVDFACDAAREGWTVRRFAAAAGLPKSTAHVYLRRGKEVLVELGEVTE